MTGSKAEYGIKEPPYLMGKYMSQADINKVFELEKDILALYQVNITTNCVKNYKKSY